MCDSVVGTAHKRVNKPNQDAVFPPTRPTGRVGLVALADGHGSRTSFRSDRGAKYAAEVAVEQLAAYDTPEWLDIKRRSDLRHDAEVELPRRIVKRWEERVKDDYDRQPFTETELEPLTEGERLAAVADDGRLAYGTTVLAVLVLPHCAIYLQLGDGDILVVGDDGDEAARPLPADERSFANETASLCSPGGGTAGRRRPGGAAGPWVNFRVRVVQMEADPPALVLLTTDGYVNAFVNDAAFRKAATDILALGRNEGWDSVQQNLKEWLEEATKHGSGDDVTVALLIREDTNESGGCEATQATAEITPRTTTSLQERGSPKASVSPENEQVATRTGLMQRCWAGVTRLFP
jgi:serine/threonine protein phosphatase PrpC